MLDIRKFGNTERFTAAELDAIQGYTAAAISTIIQELILGGKTAVYGMGVTVASGNSGSTPKAQVAIGGVLMPTGTGRRDAVYTLDATTSSVFAPLGPGAPDKVVTVYAKPNAELTDRQGVTTINESTGVIGSTDVDKRSKASVEITAYDGIPPAAEIAGRVALAQVTINRDTGVTTISDLRPRYHSLLGSRPNGTAGSHHTGGAGGGEKIKLEEEVQGRLRMANMDLSTEFLVDSIPASSSPPSAWPSRGISNHILYDSGNTFGYPIQWGLVLTFASISAARHQLLMEFPGSVQNMAIYKPRMYYRAAPDHTKDEWTKWDLIVSQGRKRIQFDSDVNLGSDFGYIEFRDDENAYLISDVRGGGAEGGTNENSAMVMGVENDGCSPYVDFAVVKAPGAVVLDAPFILMRGDVLQIKGSQRTFVSLVWHHFGPTDTLDNITNTVVNGGPLLMDASPWPQKFHATPSNVTVTLDDDGNLALASMVVAGVTAERVRFWTWTHDVAKKMKETSGVAGGFCAQFGHGSRTIVNGGAIAFATIGCKASL